MSNTRSIQIGETCAVRKFVSLENINAAHIELLQRTKSADDPKVMDLVECFVSDACSAGAILEADEDREAAQKLVTYWSNILYRADRQPKETLLEEFSAEACPDIPDDQFPYRTLDTGGKSSTTVPAGWQRLVRECLKILQHDKIVAIVGQPGCGRGFLIYDGLLPKLKADAVDGSATWRIIEFTPTANPLSELISLVSPDGLSAEGVRRQCELFRRDSSFLNKLFDGSGTEPVLLIIKRFEQFFNVKSEDSAAFFSNLQKLVDAGKHRVIIKLRSDYLAQVASDEKLDRLLERSQVLLALTAHEIRQTIEEPAKRVGLHFEAGLVDRLVQDVQGEPTAAQLLRFTLTQLWDHRDRNRITWDEYRKLGGGRVAVERTAERLFLKQLADRPEELMQQIWTMLVRLDVGRAASGQTIARGDFCREIQNDKATLTVTSGLIDATLGELVEARLLRVIGGATPPDDRFTIAQQVLIHCWPRLVEWVEAKRDDFRRLLRLRSAADQWRSRSEGTELLWGGSSLEEAERDPQLSRPEFEKERNFIEASRKYVNRTRLRRTVLWSVLALSLITVVGIGAKFQGEIKAAKEKARADLEEQKTQAMAREKDASMLQKDVSLLQLSAASTLFGQKASNFDAQESDPSGALVWYSKAHELANSTKSGLTPEKRQTVLDNYSSRLAFAFRASPRVLHCLMRPKLKMATTTKNGRWALTVDSTEIEQQEVNLWDLNTSNPHPQTVKHDSKVNAARFSADSNFLVTGTKSTGQNGVNSLLSLWHLDDSGASKNTKTGSWLMPGPQIELVAIRTDGKRLLAVVRNQDSDEKPEGQSGDAKKLKSSWTIFLVRTESGRRDNDVSQLQVVESATSTCPVTSLDFSEIGHKCFFATNNSDNVSATISIWDYEDVSMAPSTIKLDSRINFASFVRFGSESDDSNFLLSCSGNSDGDTGEVIFWQIGPGNNSKRLKSYKHDGGVVQAAVSPDQQHIATASFDKTACILDLQKKESDPEFSYSLIHPANVGSVAFSPDGLLVATACRDQRIRIWNTSTVKLVTTLECGGTPGQVAFSGDGQRLFAQAGIDKALVWDLATEALPPITLSGEGVITYASFEANCNCAVTVEESDERLGNRQVRVRNFAGPDAPNTKWEFPIERKVFATIDSAVINPQGDCVAICGSGKVGLYWKTGIESAYVGFQNMSVKHACFSADGKKLLIAGNTPISLTGVVRVWSLDSDHTVTPFATLEGQMGELKYACFSHNGDRILTCGGAFKSPDSIDPIRGEAIIWSIRDGSAIETQKLARTKITGRDGRVDFKGHDEPILFGAFSPDETNQYVVTTSVDDSACIWDSNQGGSPVATLRREMTSRFHTADVVSAAFVPTERNQVVTVGKDGRAILWDWKNNRTNVLNHDGDMLNGVIFSKSGRYFLTTSESSKARVWDRLVALSDSSTKDAQLSESPMRVSPLIAVLEHLGPIISAGVGSNDVDRFLTLNYVGTARSLAVSDSSSQKSQRPRPENPSTMRGVQLNEWDFSSVKPELLPAYMAASSALAQRKVKPESQTLESISPDELNVFIEESVPQFQSLQTGDSRLVRTKLRNHRQAAQAEATGNWYAAAWHLGQLIDLGDPSPDLLGRRANCLARNGWYKAAIHDWESVCENPDNSIAVMAYRGLARSEAELAMNGLVQADDKIQNDEQREHGNRAIEYFDKAIRLDGSQDDLIAQRGQIKWRLGETEAAIGDYTTAIKNANPHLPGEQLADLYKMRARLYVSSKERELAFNDYVEAGKIYAKTFDGTSFAAATAAFTAASKSATGPNDKLLQKLEGALMVNADRYSLSEDPERMIRIGIEKFSGLLSPDADWKILRELARAHQKLREVEKSFDYYSQALEQAKKQSVDLLGIKGLCTEFANALKLQSDWNRVADVLTSEFEFVEADPMLRRTILQERASVYSRLGKWDLVLLDLNACIEMRKQDEVPSQSAMRVLYTLRASAHAQLAQWSEAVVDLDLSLEGTPTDDAQRRILTFYRLALSRLMEGKNEEYRNSCRELLEEYKLACDAVPPLVTPTIRNNVAWTLALSPDSGIPATQATEIARLAVSERPGTQTYHNTLRTAYYREQKYDEILKSWATSEQERVKGDEATDAIAIAADAFVLAMTYFAQKNELDARKWYDQGVKGLQALEQRAASGAEPIEDMAIWSRLEVRILQMEAEKVLGNQKAETN